MKRIIAALSLALGASGCFWNEGGAVSATWSISVGGAAATCADVGGHTVEIVSTRVSNGTKYRDLYDCADYHGVTGDMRPGLYDVVVRLYDDKGNQLSDDYPVEVDVNSSETVNAGSFDFAFEGGGGGGGGGGDPVVGNGKMTATWSVMVNGTESTCEEVGAATFDIVTNEGSATGFQRIFSFPCTAATGTTGDMPAGHYVVSVRLLDSRRNEIQRTAVSNNVPVGVNETTNLGKLQLVFAFRSASLRVKMGSSAMTGGNCGPTSSQGAGVVQQEIQVTSESRMQCMAVTITGVRDSNDELSSTRACTGFTCQAETTNQVLSHLPKGNYLVRVLGYKTGGGAPNALCYVSPSVNFAIGDVDVDLGTITAPYDTTYDTQNLCGVQ